MRKNSFECGLILISRNMTKSKNQILDCECTIWNCYDGDKVHYWPLWYILKRVAHFSENESRIIKLRGVDGDDRREIKRSLPVWMPGRWTDKSKDGLQSFGGFAQFDLDHTPDPRAVIQFLATIPSVALASVSCSGTGVYGLLSVPQDAQDETRYQALWYAFRDHLRAQGLELDPSGKNINRLRFISLDDAFYIPRACEEWTECKTPPPSFTVSASSPSPSYTSTVSRPIDPNRRQYSYAQRLSFCQSLTDQALALGIDPAPTKSLWYTMGRSLASDFGEQGRGMFISLSGIWESQNGTQRIDPNGVYDECIRLANQWEGGSFLFQKVMRMAGITLKK